MPYCEVTSNKTDPDTQLNNGVKIFYRTYGHGPTKVLLIIGLAGTHESWGPQIRGLTGTETPNDDDESPVGDCSDNEASFGGDGIEVCAFDNRGMGRSSVPTKKSEYTVEKTREMTNKNYGKGCHCFVGSVGLDKGPCFWSFNG
ncbi:hypothetical protein G4B88_023656 [Cannabis sativa]|uniref:Uncharacterized protein n=1 Tax=Cannabis sativa TaxID=3483 RepID=A0A7J6HV17_CANSA|nr:hypothetical protein G4B88_023656 [Cannabis sativa]